MFLFLVPLWGLYVFGGLYLIYKCSAAVGVMFGSVAVRVLVGMFLLAVLYGDEVLTYLTWRYDCNYRAGMYIYNNQPVSGFFYSDFDGLDEGGAENFLAKGYTYVEGVSARDKGADPKESIRFRKSDAGKVVGEAVTDLKSEFRFVRDIQVGFPHVYLMRSRVYKTSTDEVMGESLEFKYSGGEILRLLKSLVGMDKEGSADFCSGNTRGRSLIKETIPPIN
ncbi:hypothetical protein [Pseudomonas gingeri]|uniref:hypothetical protein n=1 Tax=Pseudomonas gingeri TaxID=117681 RepID=UPI0015A276F5|nr:hypothetical protein [Pseudomonas gingeri]NWA08439.1 hypothetical protein [Pseudomonas gingeri]